MCSIPEKQFRHLPSRLFTRRDTSDRANADSQSPPEEAQRGQKTTLVNPEIGLSAE